ncbi:hypothetical protein Pcinc_003976 [Petrolisthes cinctipes]|uniref:Uncharacterized protein n=1 Tax=Petrolisthes cinctipes TaxID=88211 RepID=A0AAE1L458_PETCI|nr:hypothetical protein Pcinc_003976 [Petrolisthes cinctipes]
MHLRRKHSVTDYGTNSDEQLAIEFASDDLLESETLKDEKFGSHVQDVTLYKNAEYALRIETQHKIPQVLQECRSSVYVDRKIKKTIASAAEIIVLKEKDSSNGSLILEKCGTEVEDDEVLQEVMGEVLLFLVDGEQYSPTGTSLNVDQLPNQPTVPETTPDESLPVTEGTSHAQFPQISAIPLPELSGSTRASLMEGDMARCVWLQLIEESKNYYMKFFPEI